MKKFATRVAALVSLPLALVATAHAELPAGVSTAISGAGTDGGTIVAAMATAGAAVFLISKILKRFGVSL